MQHMVGFTSSPYMYLKGRPQNSRNWSVLATTVILAFDYFHHPHLVQYVRCCQKLESPVSGFFLCCEVPKGRNNTLDENTAEVEQMLHLDPMTKAEVQVF